jgi:hypothetical protein
MATDVLIEQSGHVGQFETHYRPRLRKSCGGAVEAHRVFDLVARS